jgi:hypothetical protein
VGTALQVNFISSVVLSHRWWWKLPPAARSTAPHTRRARWQPPMPWPYAWTQLLEQPEQSEQSSVWKASRPGRCSWSSLKDLNDPPCAKASLRPASKITK